MSLRRAPSASPGPRSSPRKLLELGLLPNPPKAVWRGSRRGVAAPLRTPPAHRVAWSLLSNRTPLRRLLLLCPQSAGRPRRDVGGGPPSVRGARAAQGRAPAGENQRLLPRERGPAGQVQQPGLVSGLQDQGAPLSIQDQQPSLREQSPHRARDAGVLSKFV
ncbi:UPF0691 protein C9orf116 homolog isoform X1 [Cervus canadensis]|uniref:UPF0691 protein C9orf116 homolog isoform X1 n=1 Tax=Cervus canadensis TaxID=1574408 RepID=UPI001C9E4B5D|nr:UPF0691 protein C9orf116 homolog isoform X1 [Cervus canadensis]